MRSLHVIGSREEGGAERFFLRVTGALTALGEELLCVLRPSSRLRERLAPPVRHEVVRMRSILDPFARSRIAALSRAFEAQVVQTYMGRATRLTRLPARATGPVHVARVGGYHDVKSLRHAHAWIASTQGIRDHLVRSGLPEPRVFCIGHAVDPPVAQPAEQRAALRARLALPPGAALLACLGRLHRDRGVDVLLHAMALTRLRGSPEPHLLVVGEGPEEQSLRGLSSELGVAQRVHFVPEAPVPGRYLNAADVLVYPSREAPVGSAVLEAWNHGVPVIATRTRGPQELIRDGVDGVLVPLEAPEALARAIGELLGADAAIREALVQAGRQRIEREFSAGCVARAHQEVYARLRAQPPAA